MEVLLHAGILVGTQSCQLPDFNQRSQTLCDIVDFPTTLSYMPKTRTFSHPITKHPERTLEFQYFYSVLQKIPWVQTKTKKVPRSRCLFLLLGRPMACGNAYVKHFAKFPDLFLRHNVGNLVETLAFSYQLAVSKWAEAFIWNYYFRAKHVTISMLPYSAIRAVHQPLWNSNGYTSHDIFFFSNTPC